MVLANEFDILVLDAVNKKHTLLSHNFKNNVVLLFTCFSRHYKLCLAVLYDVI